MALYAMLSVDLENDISAAQRNKFNSILNDLQWTKHTKLTTIWTASLNAGSIADAFETAKSDIIKAANFAAIHNYHAIVQFGPEAASEISSDQL